MTNMIQRVRQAVFDRLVAAEVAEETAAILQRRRTAVAAVSENEAPLLARKAELKPQIERAQQEVQKRQEALTAAQRKLFALQLQERHESGQLDQIRRVFQQFMSETAPSELFWKFSARIDQLLQMSVPETASLSHSNVAGSRTILVEGDASARREALFRLRQSIFNEWQMEPLSDQEFSQRFDAAIGGLPGMVPPPQNLDAYFGETAAPQRTAARVIAPALSSGATA